MKAAAENSPLTDDERATIENKAWIKARNDYHEETKPQREREKFEGFKRMVRSGDSGTISSVIFHALTNRDIAADVALREYIAELVDAGQDDMLNTQLRFYLVQYLVHPLVRPLGSFVRE
jgi:hypothetical protein